MSKLARYRKVIAGLFGTLAILAVSIPTDADPKLIALGGLVTNLAVLLGPANAPAVGSRADLIDHLPPPTRVAEPEERPRRRRPPDGL